MRDRIIIAKDLVPYEFEISLADTSFIIGVDYNRTGDFFTLSLFDIDGNVINRGEKLVYNMELWQDTYDVRKYPCLTIKPVDQSGTVEQITWGNFGEKVFLEIFDQEGDEAEV